MELRDHMKEKIKILHIITTMDFGGAEVRLWDEITHADPAKYSLAVAYLKGDGEILKYNPQFKDVHIMGLIKKGKFSVLKVFNLISFIICAKPHYIHTHLIHASILGRFLGFIFNIPVITTQHHAYQFKDNSWIYKIERLSRRFTNHFIAISNYVKTYLEKTSYHAKSYICVIPTGIQINELIKKSLPVVELIKKIDLISHKENLNTETVFIGTIANFRPQKNYKYFFEALQFVAKEHSNIIVIVIGGGLEILDFQKQVFKLEIADKVLFMGSVPNAFQWAQIFDIFVLSSEQEAFGRVLLEAMLFKKPIVATNVEGIPEVIVPFKTGLLVPARQPETLADAIIQLIKNPNLQKEYGDAGFERLEKNFSFSDHVARLVKFYTQDVRGC